MHRRQGATWAVFQDSPSDSVQPNVDSDWPEAHVMEGQMRSRPISYSDAVGQRIHVDQRDANAPHL